MSKFISIIQVRGCERIPFQISPRKARKLVENGILIEVTYSGCLISNPRIITTHQHTNSTDRISTFVSNVSILCRSLSRYIRSKTLTKHIDERFMLCATHPLPISTRQTCVLVHDLSALQTVKVWDFLMRLSIKHYVDYKRLDIRVL